MFIASLIPSKKPHISQLDHDAAAKPLRATAHLIPSITHSHNTSASAPISSSLIA
jgi:hypothetical protein